MRVSHHQERASQCFLAPHRCHGIALVECIVYFSLFCMVVFLSFMAYDRTNDTSRKLQKNAEEIASSLHAGERWREDIRQAIKEPVLLDHSMQIQQTLGEVRYVFRDGSIFRQTASDKAPAQILRDVKKSLMIKDAGKTVASWRWEVELNTKEKSPRTKPLFTFQAVAPLPAK